MGRREAMCGALGALASSVEGRQVDLVVEEVGGG